MARVNLKQAPRRQVEGIDRIGAWGRVEYHHRLDCGHIEVRKRPSKTGTMACSGCVLSEKHQEHIAEQKPPSFDEDLWDQTGAALAVQEGSVARLKAALVARFGVPPEAVDVAVDDDDGTLRVSYAVILLSASEILEVLSGD